MSDEPLVLNRVANLPAHPSGGRLTEVHSPADGSVIAHVALSGSEDVDAAVDAAHSAFGRWSSTTPSERSRALLRAADLIDEHRAGFAELEMRDVGKPIAAALEEVAFVADNLRLFAAAARTLHGPSADTFTTSHLSLIRREPFGVVGQVAAWNFPLMMAVWKVGPAIAAGNTVVLKPSELTPLSTDRLAELLSEVLPPGVVNVVHGTGPDVGAALVGHRRVRMISVTGSAATGRAVAAVAASGPTPVHLELGGKAPAVVFDDADLDAVAAAVRAAGYYNAGQDCTAITRVICQRDVADELRKRLAEQIAAIAIGDPAEHATELGPVVSAAHRDTISAAVSVAEDDGWVLTGRPAPSHGFFVPARIVGGLPPGHPLTRTEIFGPLVTFETFDSEADVVALVNEVGYGLVASVWTAQATRAVRMACRLDVGTVWVNAHQVLTSEMPHGGRRQSGCGSDMSALAVHEYTQPKHIMLAMGDDADVRP